MIRTSFLVVFLVLVSGTLFASDPFDGMTLKVNRGGSPDAVSLQWTGGQPSFTVYRSATPVAVVAPPNQIALTPDRAWNDTPPAGAAWFYVIKSPCVYNPPEVCDGVDNNCDGLIDEGNPGGGLSCNTGLPGPCGPGITSCGGGQIVCNPNVNPSPEICDGVDNNCNGQVDEGNPGGGGPCSTGLPGVCGPGTGMCTNGQATCQQNVQSSSEVCDGADNNCNGQVDEGNPGGGGPCSTGLPGVCGPGTGMCTNGQATCQQNVQSSSEVCDGADNNCNGQVDEGNPGGGGPCSTGLPGVCGPGTGMCTNGQATCQQNVQSSSEVCDGADNNCNGQVDEGNPGGGGPCSTGLPGVCGPGTGMCTNGQATCQQNVQSSSEVCDGADNNCNGQVDEGNPGGGGPCSTGLPGVCGPGTGMCTNGQATCQQNVQSSSEVCDGADNNCNGQVDEGNPGGGGPCSTGLPGVCGPGTGMCTNGQATCQQNVQSSSEVCDGADNNCNGQVDEGNPGGGGPCSTGLLGVCGPGTVTCTGGGQLTCQQNVQSSSEVCDGADNNCNGQVDEGNPGGGGPCSTGLPGVCGPGTGMCTNGQATCQQNVQSSSEVCDGADNNCNGQVDEGNPGGGGPCSTGLLGVCGPGTVTCTGGGQLTCQQNVQPSAEVCDGLDNNCDGTADSPSPSCSLANANSACAGGTCVVTSCNSGYADCDGLAADGCEVNTTTNTSNCGACGIACEIAAICSAGVCGPAICSSGPLWTYPISGPAPALTAIAPATSSLKLAYVVQNSTLYAVKRAEPGAGSVSWTWTDPSAGTINNFPSPVPLSNGGLYIYLGAADGSLYKINAGDGSSIHSADLRRATCPSDSIIATPSVQLYQYSNATFQADMNAHGRTGDDLVIVVTKNGCGDSTSNRIIGLYASDLAVKWQFNADGTHLMDYGSEGCEIDNANNRTYCGTAQTASRPQNTLWAINSIDGTAVWAANAGAIRNRPMLKNGSLYVANMSGILSKRKTVDGSAQWSVPFGPSSVGCVRNPWPEFRGGSTAIVVLVDTNGVAHAIHDAGTTASTLWRTPAGPVYTTAPLVIPQLGKVFLGRNDGYVQQIDLADGHDDAKAFVGPGSLSGPALAVDYGGADVDRLLVTSVGPASGTLGYFCVPWVNGTNVPPARPPCTAAADCAPWANQCDDGLCKPALGSCYSAPSAEGLSCTNSLGCAGSSVCRNGACVSNNYGACVCSAAGDKACSGSTTCCGAGACVDLKTDPSHCGACNLDCGVDKACVNGVCSRNPNVCTATSSSVLNGTPGTVHGANAVAYDRQGSTCNAYIAGMDGGGGLQSKAYRVDPTGLVTPWANPAPDLSPLNGVAVSLDGRALISQIANEVLGVPPAYNPGLFFVDPSVGSPHVPSNSPKTYSNQPFTIQALNQGPVGPALDPSSVTPGLGGARGFAVYIANWNTNGDLVVAKRDCSIVPSCTWTVGPVSGWPPPAQRISAIAFGTPPGGHRTVYLAYGTRLARYDTQTLTVSSTIDLATAYVPAPGSGVSTVLSIKSIAVDALYGDLYVDVGDVLGKRQILMQRVDDGSVRNVRHVQLDLGATPVAPFTFTSDGRLTVVPTGKVLRLVPTTPGGSVVSTSEYGACP